MEETPKDRFKMLLANNVYMALATTNGQIPWISPVFFAYDDEFNLYFVSRKDSRHAQFIMNNPNVAISIFDSHATPKTCDGVQMQAICRQTEGVAEITHAAMVLYTRRFADEKERLPHLSPALFKDAMKMRLYKVTPQEIYVVDTSRPDDYRVQIEL